MILYIFDRDKRVRKLVPMEAVSELVHDEADKTITATIADDSAVKTGEHIGFMCVDGHFRLFTIQRAEKHDDTHTIYMRGTDAIIRELQQIIVEELQQLDVGLKEAIGGLLDAAGVSGMWTITGDAPARTEKSRAYYTSVYEMLEAYRTLYAWQYDAWYNFEDGEIAGRIIHLSADEAVFRGRVLTSKRDATSVYVTSTTEPVTRLYGIGPSTGSGDVQTNLTFADAVWSKANGDPADKPKGQTWVEDEEAVAAYGLRTGVEQIQELQIDGEEVQEDKKPEVLLQKTWERLQQRKHPSCTVEAVIQDMEQVPGYEHQIIRMGDMLPIRLTDATMEEARVIRIKRDYVRPWMTKLTIGDKTETIQTQVSSLIVSASHTFERLTIYKNRFHEDEALIQLNAKHIQRNAETIVDHAEQILLRAEKKDLEAAQILIDGINERVTAQAKQIELKASKGDLDEAVLRLDAAEGSITAQGKKIDAQAEQIALKASQGDLDEAVLRLDAAEGSITAQGKKIDAQAEEIALKASNLRVDAIETTISGLVKVDELRAQFINAVDGSVIAGMLQSETLDVQSLVAASVNTEYLSADDITTDTLSTGEITIGGVVFNPSDYVTGASLSGTLSNYATKSWVIEKGYATSSDVALTLSGYVTTAELANYPNNTHSHAVTVNEDGTVTLGEVSSSGGSFRIADTKTYKDGVSAAINSVTLSALGWQGGSNTVRASNGKEIAVALPAFTASGGDSFTAAHKTTVYFYTASVQGYLASREVDASSVYDAGYQAARDAYYDSRYQDGYDDGVLAGYDNGYAAGYQAARDAVRVEGGITSITNPAQGYYMAKGWAAAKLDGDQIDYTTFSKSQQFS